MCTYLKSLVVPTLITLFLSPLVYRAAQRDVSDPTPKSIPQLPAPPDLAGEWRESGLVYQFKPSLDGKFVKIEQAIYPATATWDGRFLIVKWAAYTGCYEWKDRELIGWYCQDSTGCVTQDRFFRKP